MRYNGTDRMFNGCPPLARHLPEVIYTYACLVALNSGLLSCYVPCALNAVDATNLDSKKKNHVLEAILKGSSHAWTPRTIRSRTRSDASSIFEACPNLEPDLASGSGSEPFVGPDFRFGPGGSGSGSIAVLGVDNSPIA